MKPVSCHIFLNSSHYHYRVLFLFNPLIFSRVAPREARSLEEPSELLEQLLQAGFTPRGVGAAPHVVVLTLARFI